MIVRYGTVVEIFESGRWRFFSQQAWIEAQYAYERGEKPMDDREYLAACRDVARQEDHTGGLRIMPLVPGEPFPIFNASTVVD